MSQSLQMKIAFIAIHMSWCMLLCEATPEKIAVDTKTRLYVGAEDGRVHMFHGLSIEDSSPPWNLATYNDTQIELMKKWGLNVVRMGFQWHMVEPKAGEYNRTYIQNIVDFIKKLNEHDVHVILDMHQDCWSPLFCNAHGIPPEYSQGYNSNFKPGGDKAYPQPVVAPSYDQHGHIVNCNDVGKHIFGWATCYTTYAVGAASQRLYDNDQGILDSFGKFWQLIASSVSQFPNVLGYELINEPWLGNVPLKFSELFPTNPHWDLWFPKNSDRKNMVGMYKKLHNYIRAVDNQTIIFFEPATGGNLLDAFPVGFEEGPGGPEYNDRQALSYHVYCPFVDAKNATGFIQHIIADLSIGACDILDDALYDVRRDDTKRLNLAGFLTEFGNAGTDTAAEDTIEFAADKMDEFYHGWTYWYLTPSPDKDNSKEVQALARPFPRKIAGVPVSFHFNTKSKDFELEYTPCIVKPCADLPTEIYTSKNYAYASVGFKFTVDTKNVVHTALNDTTQTLLIQVVKLSKGENIKIRLFPST